jgi:LuxR family maltose regulon positive regulatory protein
MRTSETDTHAVQWRVRSSQPDLPPHIVHRSRLVDSVSEGLHSPGSAFAVLSAPAGYGKTIALSQWMAMALGNGHRVGWCSLERDDRDPIVFWESVLSVIKIAAATENTALVRLPELPHDPPFEAREHRRFVSAVRVALEELREDVTLIFDDTHLLAGSESEGEFVDLLGLCPPNVHIAFATRTALPDQRARLARRVWEIDAQSLLFTRTETAELFDRFAIDGSLVEEVFRASEGWPAVLGLALPGLASAAKERAAGESPVGESPLRESVVRGNLVQESPALARGPGELLDPDALYEYFEREIFDQLDPADQPTLLACAIAPVISADLASAILDREGSAFSLRRLARNNPMLRRLAADPRGRSWYRANPLFVRFLREKLLATQPDLLRKGTERAVRWQLAHGDPRAALRLAVELGESELLHAVVRRVGCELVADGHCADLLALGSLPGLPLHDDPFSPLVIALAAVSSGKVERAEATLAGATSDGLHDEDALEWDWLHYVIAVRIALARGHPIRGIFPGWTDDTLPLLPPALRAAVHLTRGLAQTRDGDISDAREQLEASRVTAESSGDLASEVLSLVGLAGADLAHTSIRESIRHAESAVSLAGASHTQDLSLALTAAHSLIAWGTFQMVDVASARSHAESALRYAAQQPHDDVALQALHVHQVVCFEDLPDRRHAAQEFTAAWPPSYLQHAPPSLVVPSLHVGLTMARVLGEPRWAERLLERARSALGDVYDWKVASAVLHYSMGRHSSARAILAPLLENSIPTRTATSEIIAWSLESVLDFESGNPFRAHEAMCRSLQKADETGAFAEVLRSDPNVVRTVLTRGLDRFADHIPVAEQLIASHVQRAESGVGHLTPKERELLSELKSLRTVAEISSDMLLSINTVKTHMRGIYRKLDVSSRRRAVAEAERRGLI